MMHETGKKVYGEPEQWEFDYSFEKVKLGFWLWEMSGFKYLPTQDEVDQYDSRWVSDMRLAQTIYAHQGNDSIEMRLLEQYEQFSNNPDAYRAVQQAARQKDDTDGAFNALSRRSYG
jgi:hypothetical protein